MDVLRVTVIWCPEDDEIGLPLANAIARHFDNAEESRAFGGIRLPVFVRFQAFAPGSSAPRPIDLDAAAHNLVVALSTGRLVERIAEDEAWGEWFDDLSAAFARRGDKDRFVTVSMEQGALSLRGFPNRQSVRAYEWGLDPAYGAFQTRLLLLLTNRGGSLLAAEEVPAGPTGLKRVHKERLFISHAKLDGVEDALRIRRRLDETDFGIEPFVDANDLTGGEKFSDELEAEIADATLLVIHTDGYSTRPFCRWEVLRAKFHRRPIYVVHRLRQGESRVFPYGGNVPLTVVAELNDETIDRVLLAAMTIVLRSMVWRRLAEAVVQQKGMEADAVLLARSPELVDLAHLKMRGGPNPPRVIVYPDPALSDEERELIPALNLGIDVVSLSELEAQP